MGIEKYNISDLILFKKRYYLSIINRNDPDCVNIDSLKIMVYDWSVDNWIDFLEAEFGDTYIIDRNSQQYWVKEMTI